MTDHGDSATAPSVPPPLPPVPESLLAPLMQWAGEVLREMEAQDVPPAARPLLSFDRRGFGSAAARQQLRRVLDTEDAFRAQVFEALAGREEVQGMLQEWSRDRAVEAADTAEKRDDLPLLASALVAGRPEGWELGMGVVAGLWERGLEERAAASDRQAFDTQVEKAREAQRRAEAEVAGLRAEVERLADELRAERASRRDREEGVRTEAQQAEARVAALEQELEGAREAVRRAEERAGREADRADGFDEQLKTARAEVARTRAEAQRLAGDLAAVRAEQEGAEDAGAEAAFEPEPDWDVEPEAPALKKRVPVPLPPGVIGPSLEGLRHALSAGDPAILVDGYNVSMLAWGGDEPDTQRQRLCALLERLHLRTNRSVTVVFDGADVEGVRPPRRPGVRVLFSAPGEEADDVVVREARSLPLERPVIVVSSDRKVQDGAEAAGALAVPSDVFLDFIRK